MDNPPGNDPILRIGEIAAFFNVSVKAIRIYDKLGIIKPAKIDPDTGYRYYRVDQIEKFNALLELKQLGFSLAEIKKLLKGGFSNNEFMEALTHKKIFWQNAIVSAESKISAIDRIAAELANSKPALKIHRLTEEERAWLLVKMASISDLKGQSQLSEAIWL